MRRATLIASACAALAGAIHAATINPQVLLNFDGSLSGSTYTLGAGELDATGTLVAFGSPTLVAGVATNDLGSVPAHDPVDYDTLHYLDPSDTEGVKVEKRPSSCRGRSRSTGSGSRRPSSSTSARTPSTGWNGATASSRRTTSTRPPSTPSNGSR